MQDATTLNSTIKFLLVRHGQTDWNAVGRIQGHSDIPLNPIGLVQAEECATRLHAEFYDTDGSLAIVSSDLQRAHQTAQAIAHKLGTSIPQIPFIVNPALRERHYGVLEGLTHLEIQQQHPIFFHQWRNRDVDARFIVDAAGRESESLFMLRNRAVTALNNLAQHFLSQTGAPVRTVIVVSHGGFIDTVMRVVRRMSLSEARRVEVTNASVHRVHWDEGVLSYQHS